jgi:Flp pilus assembly protein TadD
MKFALLFISCSMLALAACTPMTNDGAGPTSAVSPQIGANTLNVADAAIASGNPTMALSVSQSVLASDPHDVDALIHEGDAYYALGRCFSAEAAYKLALTNNPKSSDAETGLGRCYLRTDLTAAIATLDQAIADNPNDAAAYNDLGIAYDLKGDFTGAIAPFQQALAVNPGMSAVEVNLGMALVLSDQGNEALQYLGPLATGPSATPKIREDYAAALVSVGRVDEARSVLAIDLSPDAVDSAIEAFQNLPQPTPVAADVVPSDATLATPTSGSASHASPAVTKAPLED